MPKILAVTSFSQDGYEKYGRRMIDSFLANTNDDFGLFVFTDEDLQDVSNHSNRVVYYALDKVMPTQRDFEIRHLSPVCHGIFYGQYDYRYDAVRFSHKPAAIAGAWSIILNSPDLNPEVLMWLDGDTVFKKPLPLSFIESKFKTWGHIGHFPRKNNHTEGGIILFRVTEENVQEFIRVFWNSYVVDNIFRLPGWSDCHVLDVMLAGAHRDGYLRAVNLGDDLSFETQHPIVNSDWFQYVDHLKGARKDVGSSYESDIVTKAAE